MSMIASDFLAPKRCLYFWSGLKNFPLPKMCILVQHSFHFGTLPKACESENDLLAFPTEDH